MMSEILRKRSRELDINVADYIDVRDPKRFQAEETNMFHHLMLLDNTLAATAEEECAPTEEILNGAMRSLEEEIGLISYPSSNFRNDSASYDRSSGHEGENLAASDTVIDLIYLLEASDDELGIPLSTVLDLQDKVCQLPAKETSECWLNNDQLDLESLGENWHFEDDFVNCQQLAWYGDACDASHPRDYMNRDFVSQYLCFEGDFSAARTMETADCI